MHAAFGIALRHFLMNDAAAGGHPLNISRSDGAFVAHAVTVLDGSCENVSDGFNSTMRMPRKSGQIVCGNVVAEIIEKEEGIEVGGVVKTERAAKVNSGAFDGGLRSDQALDGTDGHVCLRWWRNDFSKVWERRSRKRILEPHVRPLRGTNMWHEQGTLSGKSVHWERGGV